jgi:hypothetical protein
MSLTGERKVFPIIDGPQAGGGWEEEWWACECGQRTTANLVVMPHGAEAESCGWCYTLHDSMYTHEDCPVHVDNTNPQADNNNFGRHITFGEDE